MDIEEIFEQLNNNERRLMTWLAAFLLDEQSGNAGNELQRFIEREPECIDWIIKKSKELLKMCSEKQYETQLRFIERLEKHNAEEV